jgi:hypothetical protein
MEQATIISVRDHFSSLSDPRIFWKKLTPFAMVESTRSMEEQTTQETRYFTEVSHTFLRRSKATIY